jgi:ABC-type uncharacterized transport system substrate-binding protein
MAQFRRRQFLIGAGALLVAPLTASAQGHGRPRTVGQLIEWPKPNLENVYAQHMRALIQERFKTLGWDVGTNVTLRPLYASYDTSRLPALAMQLVDERVDVIWASTTSAAVAAVHATKRIPIVLAGAAAYPVECGLIKSFAHPGRNVTGVAFFQGIEVQSKLAQYVRDILPTAHKLAWIAFPPDLITVSGGEFRPEGYYRNVARNLGFELGYYECRKAEDFDPVFAAIRAWGAQAVIVESSPISNAVRGRIAQLAIDARIPSFYNIDFSVLAGGFLSYGPIYGSVLEQTVAYVDRVLRGTRPADLPVEMPNRLELVINQKTAKAMGVAIPDSILVQADRVIE